MLNPDTVLFFINVTLSKQYSAKAKEENKINTKAEHTPIMIAFGIFSIM
jgi:hypothetical protein